jgi:hypothetical protein
VAPGKNLASASYLEKGGTTSEFHRWLEWVVRFRMYGQIIRAQDCHRQRYPKQSFFLTRLSL